MSSKTDFSTQFMKNLTAVAQQDNSPGRFTANADAVDNSDSPLSVRSGDNTVRGATRGTALQLNPSSVQQQQRSQQQQAALQGIVSNASPQAPLSSASETFALRSLVDDFIHHSTRIAAPPLGCASVDSPAGAGDEDASFLGAKGGATGNLEDTLPFAAGSGGGMSDCGLAQHGPFAGHTPQSLPMNMATATLMGHPLANPTTSKQHAEAGGSRGTSRSPAPSSSRQDDNGSADFSSSAAFFEAHRVYFMDEHGNMPNLPALLERASAAAAAASLSADGNTIGGDGPASLSRSGTAEDVLGGVGGAAGLSPSEAAVYSAALHSPAEAVTAFQMLSATTVPIVPKGGEYEVGGPRSATPLLLKTPNHHAQLPPAPTHYPYNGPESVYGPYFEPLAWVACGEVVGSAANGGGGTGSSTSSAGLRSRPESKQSNQSTSAAHRRLLAATAAAAANNTAAGYAPAAGAQLTYSANGEVHRSLAEACDVDRQLSTSIQAVGGGGSLASAAAAAGGIIISVGIRDWGAEWRSLLAMDSASLRMAATRTALMDAMARDFAAYVGPIAQAIVEEIRLPFTSNARQFHSLSGFPSVYVAKGLIFVITATAARKALYGSAEAAEKAAANELRAQRVIRGSPHLNTKVMTPLCCLVSILGHKVFVSAPMPIRSQQDIIYGSTPNGSAGAVPNHFTTTNFGVMGAYEVSELFNLNQHKVPIPPSSAPEEGGSGAGSGNGKAASPSSPASSPNGARRGSTQLSSAAVSVPPQITLPVDAKLVYSVADGASWLLDAARIAPSAACAYTAAKVALKDDTTGKSLSRHPSENNYNAHLSMLFRPEFLRQYAMGSTNADAGLRCQPKSEHDHLGFMINNLYCVNIPAAIADLLSLEAKGLLKQDQLTAILHSHGVNARYMGKIYSDLEHMGSKPLDVRTSIRAKLALEMAARTFKSLLITRLNQPELFTKEQLLDRLGSQHTSAVQRMGNNSHTAGNKFNAAADEEGIVLTMIQRLLLCKDGSLESFWEREMRPVMERKFGAYACPAVVADEVLEQLEEAVGADSANLKVYRCLGTSGKRRVEKPKQSIHWTDLPGGRSVVDDELTQQVQKVRQKAILYPLLGPNALENAHILTRVEELLHLEVTADQRGKRLQCAFGHKAQPCTALLYSPTVAAMLRHATTDVQAVLSMEEDPVELRTAVEAAARAEMQAFQKITESDARAVLPVTLLSKALAHKGQLSPASFVNRLQDMRKLVPSDLVTILTYFQMGELFMLSGRYDRAETALATGLLRIGQFASPVGGNGGATTAALSVTTLLGVTSATSNDAAATNTAGAAAALASTSVAAAGATATVGAASSSKAAQQQISDIHPAGFIDALALVCKSMARIVLANGKRPPTDRARLVLDYYQYAIYLAEQSHHRALPALVYGAAMFRKHWATLPRDPASEDGGMGGFGGSHYGDGHDGTVGSRGMASTKRSRMTPGVGGKRLGGGGGAGGAGGSSSASAQAAADRNRRATSLTAEDAEGNEDNDTFVKKAAAQIDDIILPRDKAVFNRNGTFPTALLCDVTTSYEFVAQLSLFQGLGGSGDGGGGFLGRGTVTISPPGTAMGNALFNATMHSHTTAGGPTIVMRDRGNGGEGKDRKAAAPTVTFNATQPVPQSSSDPLRNALTAINLSINTRMIPQEVRPMLWRAYQLMAATAAVVSRPAGDGTFGEAWVEIGVCDRDGNKVEAGLEQLTSLYGALSKRTIEHELRLVDVLFEASKTVCQYTQTESADLVVLGRAEHQLQTTLKRVLSVPNCTETYTFALYSIISRFGRLVDAYSKLPAAKREDAARRYLAEVLPPVIGAQHALLTDVFDTLRSHYMHLGEVREEAVARSNAIVTAGDYALQWLECIVEVKGTESTIAQHLRLFCEKIVKPLRSSGGAHERQAAWSFYVRCGAVIHDAPHNLAKDAKVKEAMDAIDAVFKAQHRIVVQSEKKALMQRQITEYAREMHLSVRRVRLHKNRMDHYCEIQLRNIESIGVAIRALMAGVKDDDILLRAQDALEYHDEALRVENQILQRRATEAEANGGEDGASNTAPGDQKKGDGNSDEEKGGDGAADGADAKKDKDASGNNASSSTNRRPMAKAYVSPYKCLSSPEDTNMGKILQRRLSAATSDAGGASTLQRSRSNLHPMLQPGPPPSSPGGFLPRLGLASDGTNQQVGKLINRTNQSMASKNHNPVRTL